MSRCGKRVAFTVVTSDPALADMRTHAAVFVVPLDMAVEPRTHRDVAPVPVPGVIPVCSRGSHLPCRA
jgi:hypothetical protein